MRTTPARAIAIGLCLSAAVSSSAERIEGVTFDERRSLAGTELELQGVGLFRYRWVIKAYVAALYLPSEVATQQVLSDVPKRLELEYFWQIHGADFGPVAEEILLRQFDGSALAPLRERIELLHAAYRDVEPGDRYALDYVPGRGTTLSLNGEAIVTIPGADFAAVYFAIWLGDAPLDASFKSQLLEGR
jgi:hypothetical protein